MTEGRGSASLPTVVVTVGISLLCLLALQVEHANAATYTVGGPAGWSFNTDTWPNGKKFRAGDVLIFNYDSTTHNVVAVDQSGYKSCTTPAGAKVLSSGKDQIRLGRGQNYFICNCPGHCQSGMKVAINAL
ncbi:basic blue protein-like [Lotus japonicus]|uniref:Basic blue protein n=1 Tax=Lotus japonicus TaxID=34305 RepID=I3SCS8_LOTJA|nr:basic blue protein-like [Lotus japonicus]AFK38070.1 unknown [Lotus japonicus]